jgi:penicillin-binding protein 1C
MSAVLPPSGAAPAEAILAENAELPLALRRFEPTGELGGMGPEVAMGPRLAFPEDGATLELARAPGGLPSLPLEAMGGELPYLWLVNGAVLETAPYRRQAQWQPEGRGHARITVMDRLGRSASAEIWIR